MANETELMTIEEPTASTAITRGEVDMQVATAKNYPRSVKTSLQRAETLATMNRQVAESCFFAMPRAGTTIEGPSVRLAEIFASSWGNLRVQARVIGEDKKHVTAQATVWDMETNVLVQIEAKRRIVDKNGNRYKDDMILMTQNAAVSIALRNAVFRVVPRVYIDEVYGKARKCAFGDQRTMEQRRVTAMKTFAKMGVGEDRVLTAVECDAVEDMTAEHLSKLVGLLNAIRDGSAKIEDAFPPIQANEAQTGSRTDGLLQKMAKDQAKADVQKAKAQYDEPQSQPSEPLPVPAEEKKIHIQDHTSTKDVSMTAEVEGQEQDEDNLAGIIDPSTPLGELYQIASVDLEWTDDEFRQSCIDLQIKITDARTHTTGRLRGLKAMIDGAQQDMASRL